MKKKSQLLFDEHPLVINPKLAEMIGLNEAIVLQQVHYWVNLNEKAGRNLKEGFTWTYNTLKDWKDQFPFWSAMTIRRAIKSLEDGGYLLSANLNKLRSDKTKWYRVNPGFLVSVNSPDVQDEQSLIVQNEQSSGSESTVQVSNSSRPLPETNPETNPKTNIPETTKAEPSLVDTAFKIIHAYFGFPDKIEQDPIPNYGKEGKAIKKMLGRGFTLDQIMALWTEKVQKRGGYCSMVWVNEDIAAAPPPVVEEEPVIANYQFFCTNLIKKFEKAKDRYPDGGEMESIRGFVKEKIREGWGTTQLVEADPSDAVKVEA